MHKSLKELSGLGIFSLLLALLFLPAVFLSTYITAPVVAAMPLFAILTGGFSLKFAKSKGKTLAKIGIVLGLLEIIYLTILIFVLPI